MSRIMSIDYGTKRVGLAVTDPLQLIASALETVDTIKLMDYLDKYFKMEEVECVVVGEPKKMNNEPSESTPHIEGFIRRFKEKFPEKRMERMNEMFTSKMAVRAMVDAGFKKKDRQVKSNIDKLSAVIILQDYMQSRSI